MKFKTEKQFTIAPQLVTLFGVIFLIEMLTMQVVYGSFDFFATPLSPYATGNYWYVVSSGLMMIGTSYIILSFLFLSSKGVSKRTIAIGSYILMATGISTYMLTIFQTDIGPTVSITGHIHIISAHFHFILLPLSVIWLCTGLKDRSWRLYRNGSLIFSVVLIGTGIALVFKKHIGISDFSGMIQKALIAVIVVWIIISAQVHLKRNRIHSKTITAQQL
jgi:uncharacterized membrane protein SirB2